VKKFLQAATSKPNLGDNSMQMESILQQWFTTTDEKIPYQRGRSLASADVEGLGEKTRLTSPD